MALTNYKHQFLFLLSTLVIFNLKAQLVTTPTLATTNVKGSMIVDSTTVTRDSLIAQGDVVAQKDLKVEGNLLFKNGKGIQLYTPVSGPEIYTLGKLEAAVPPPVLNPCISGLAQQPAWVFAPGPQITLSGYSGANPNVLNVGLDGANGIIDLAGTGTNGGNQGILINYYCGKT